MIIFIPKRFENSTLESFIADNEEAKKLLETLKAGIKQGFKQNILISGDVGVGKTHLAYGVIKSLFPMEKKTSNDKEYLICNARDTAYISIKEIIDTIRATWKREPDAYDLNRINDIKSAKLLIIDEVGVQYGTESERLELFDIINHRYNECLKTICLSNLDDKKIAALLGKRICDRLFGGGLTFELQGKSKR